MAKKKAAPKTAPDSLLNGAFAVIDRLFADTSVAQSVTRSRLEEIIAHCEMQIESLDPEDDDGGPADDDN